MAPNQKRRRRTPDAARQEILDAAGRLFVERPPHQVTVRAIMAATTLARPSFYEYFESRAALIMEVVAPIIEINRTVLESWPLHPPDPRRAATSVATALVRAWRGHGRLLMALADASITDEDAAAAYRAFAQDSVAQVAQKLSREIESGTVTGLDANQTALALVAMNRSYLSTQLFSPDPPPDDVLIATLVEIWVRVLWPGY